MPKTIYKENKRKNFTLNRKSQHIRILGCDIIQNTEIEGFDIMTYGEYYYRVKYDMKLVNGNWVSKPAYMKIPRRMSRKDAAIYYTEKLRKYWDNIKENK